MTDRLNILVVGGCGYIGTHMVKALMAAGHHPITLDNLSTGHRDLLPGGVFIAGDIGDTALLDDIFASQRIDAVMHFAAFIEVGESVSDPLKYYGNNVARTANLLKAMIRHDVKRFIFSSSAAIYGEPDYTPIDEDHPLNPTSPYGETKLWVEKMLAACDNAYGLRAVVLRYFNAAGADESGTIGERHEPESHLIPLVLEVARGKREHIKIFGVDYPTPDGTCIRDYIHVNDLVSAHLAAIDALMEGAGSCVYNLGNSRGVSVREVIDTAARVSGRPIPVVEDRRRPGDPAILVAGSTKIRNDLNWQPRFESLEEIVRTAWKWHASS
ncbi:MAG: UDP-glucose 4-epimerase GalE [Desulfobacterales bacterium]|nr:UDP-glucose 4-epimerase GalE [Desulfobacterales bacterium]